MVYMEYPVMTDFTISLEDPQFFMELHAQMLHFARSQLDDHHQAEDAVQEALEGAMKNDATFTGKAAWKSWVFAILRHKIADTLRQRYSSQNIFVSPTEEEDFESLFNSKGHWPADDYPTCWPRPDRAMEQEQFWLIFEICLTQIPEHHARAFIMREFIGLETHEICSMMAVTVNNLNVMLWRARMRLRECLAQRWFNTRGEHA